jgi:hypothetical protein
MGSIMIMPEENVSPFHLSSRAAVPPTPPRRAAAAAAATEAEQGNLGEAVGGR